MSVGATSIASTIAGMAAQASLHTADPGTTGANEATGGSPAYARKALTWGTPVNGAVTANPVVFDVPAGSYPYYGLWQADGTIFIGSGTLNRTATAQSKLSTADTITIGTSAPLPPLTDTTPGWLLDKSMIGLTGVGLTATDLTAYSGPQSIPEGTTLYRKIIPFWLDLSHGNITLNQCLIQPLSGTTAIGDPVITTWGSGGNNGPVSIIDSEYDGSLMTNHEQAWIGFMLGVANIVRCYVHHSGSGFNTYGSYEATFSDCVIKHNYVDHLISEGDPNTTGNHESAYTTRDFIPGTNPNRTLTVRGNYFAGDGLNMAGTILMQPNADVINNVTVQDNFLVGDNGFQMYLDMDPSRFPDGSYKNLRILNNRMDTSPGNAYFIRTQWIPMDQVTWQENYLYDAAAPDGKGTPLSDAEPNVNRFTYVFPDATNTGLTGVGMTEADLTTYPDGGNDIVIQNSPSLVIENQIINTNIRFNTSGSVTLRKCKVNGRIDASVAGAEMIIEDCTIDADGSNLLAVNAFGLAMRRCNVSGGAASIVLGPNSIAEDCYTHGQFVGAGLDTHTGAMSCFGTQNAVIRHCTINNDSVDNAAGGGPTGDFQIFGDTDYNTNIVVEYCYLAATGGGYSCALGYDPGKTYGANPTYIVFRHNLFGRGANGKGGAFGTTTDWLSDAGDGVTGFGNQYYDNIWLDTGDPVTANL